MAYINSEAEQQAINRRRAMAQALQQQAFQPIEQPQQPGVKMSWTQGLAPIVSALFAALQNRKLDKQQKSLDTKQDFERITRNGALVNALVPETPGSSYSVPMAPTQQAPIPETLGSDQMGATPEAQQPEGSRVLNVGANADEQFARGKKVNMLAQALSSRDPQIQDYAKVALQDVLSQSKEDRANQFDIAKLLQQQGFAAGQNQLNRDQDMAQADAARQAQLAVGLRPTFEQGGPGQAQGIFDPSKPGGQFTQTGTTPTSTPQPTEYAQKIADFNTHPELVKQFGSGPTGYEKWLKAISPSATSTTAADNRMDKSYQFNVGQLNTLEKPVGEAIQRLGRLQDTIGQATPQADALLAPELLTVMAGGQGSGLRMNEAEIARVIGGRSNFESLKAALNKWQVDPTKALSVTPAQRQQIQSLVKTVNDKLLQKQQILNEANQKLIGSSSVEDHRRAVDDARRKLSELDQATGKADPLGIR